MLPIWVFNEIMQMRATAICIRKTLPRCLNWPGVSHLAHLPVEDIPQIGNVLEDGHITANATIRRQNDKQVQVREGRGSLCNTR